MKRSVAVFLLFCSFLCIPACAGLSDKISKNIFSSARTPDSFDPEAGRLLSALLDKNRNIKTFKGTGRMTFSGKSGGLVSADVAWVAGDSNKISIALRDVFGRPIASIASDGEWICFVSHSDNTFYKKRSDNAGLKDFIFVPVTIKDVVLLLSGRTPVYEFDSASVEDAGNGRRVLVLKKKWSGVAGKIYFGNDSLDAGEIEIFDAWGELLYRASFEGEREVKEYRIPSRLIISNDSGDYLRLDIERFWADVPVSGSVFVLNPPEKQ